MFQRVVVVGGGVAGLLAAQAMASFSAEVVVLEAGPEPTPGHPQKGTPQGHHIHVLLARGQDDMEALVPGFLDALQKRGVPREDAGECFRWWNKHVWMLNHPSGVHYMPMSRPTLKATLRECIAPSPKIHIRWETKVAGLVTNMGRVSGVRLCDGEQVSADLVIDAAGRGSTGDRWLSEAGFVVPKRAEIKVGLSYVSCRYSGIELDCSCLAVHGSDGRLAALMPVENGEWIVTLGGYHDVAPKASDFDDFVYALEQPDVANALRQATRVSPVRTFRVKRIRRRLFEDVRRHATGFVSLGDSLCTFDPVYGQGMTVAAAQVLALRALVASGVSAKDLPGRFYAEATKILDPAWLLGAAEAFRSPLTEGDRPRGLWAVQRLFDVMLKGVGTHAATQRAVLEVMHMRRGAEALMQPAIVKRALKTFVGDPRRRAAEE